jgi:hypothetical protein
MLTALSAALLLAGASSMPLHAQDTEVIDNEVIPEQPVLNPDPGVVEVETPQMDTDTGETGDTPETPGEMVEGPAEEPPAPPMLPEGVALDNDGNAYPEGGPAGLYNAIVDKQQKVGMEGTFDAEGNLEGVAYSGGNQGQQNALSRLRSNLERKLKKLGLLEEAPTDVPDEIPGDIVDNGDLDDAPATPEISAATSLDTDTQRLAVDRGAKAEKVAKVEKAAKPTRVERVEKPQKITRLEKPQRPEKVNRVEKPQRPEKVTRVEKPQKPEKVARVEKPQRPQKPEKPAKPEKPQKPERPGRS